MKSGGVVFQRNWSVVQHCIVSLHPDLHNYRAWSETVEFFGKKKKLFPIFSPFSSTIFIPLSLSLFRLDARPHLFPRVKRVAGGKIVLNVLRSISRIAREEALFRELRSFHEYSSNTIFV